MQRPNSGVEKKYGGHVIEVDGLAAMACDHGLCADIESHPWVLDESREEVAARLGSKSGSV